MNKNWSKETCHCSNPGDREVKLDLMWQDLTADMMWLAKEKEKVKVTSKF